MKIKDPKKPVVQEPPALIEVLKEIYEGLQRLKNPISETRFHAVDSQLRMTIRTLGFRPRETREKPSSPLELAEQIYLVCESDTDLEITQAKAEFALMHAMAVLENVKAELLPFIGAAAELREIPPINPKTK